MAELIGIQKYYDYTNIQCACACACVCWRFIFYICVYVLTQVPEHVVEEIESFVEQVSHVHFPS